jgi:hypothetical protein
VTYLELCKELVSELGIAGGTGPTTVTGQTGLLGNACRWIRQANNDINVQWKNWRFLWTEYNGMVQAGIQSPPVPGTPAGVKVRQWDRSSVYLNKYTNSPVQLEFVPWPVFRAQYGFGVPTAGQPAVFSVRPDNTLIMDRPTDAIYSITGEFWRRATLLAVDNDVPDMPDEYHRLIVCTAAVKYANKEDAPEVISGMEAEMFAMMFKLQSDQLDAFEFDTMSTQDVTAAMVLPGEAD